MTRASPFTRPPFRQVGVLKFTVPARAKWILLLPMNNKVVRSNMLQKKLWNSATVNVSNFNFVSDTAWGLLYLYVRKDREAQCCQLLFLKEAVSCFVLTSIVQDWLFLMMIHSIKLTELETLKRQYAFFLLTSYKHVFFWRLSIRYMYLRISAYFHNECGM